MDQTKSRVLLSLLAAIGVGFAACASENTILATSPRGDTIQVRQALDSLAERIDTIIVDGDTVIVTVVDTVIQPSDTVFTTVTVVDTLTGDTVEVVDTVINYDTIIQTRIDTIILVDTIYQVDTVFVVRSLNFGLSELVMNLGETRDLDVTVTNALGYPVPPQNPINWFSANPNIATVDAQGVVSAELEGSTEVFAVDDVDGLSTSIGVQVVDPRTTPDTGGTTPASGDWTFTNVPSGLPLLDRNAFAELEAPEWGIRFNQSDRSPEIVSTQTPIDNTVLRQWWSGVPDSWSPHYAFINLPAVSEAFFGIIFRLSPNWDWGTGNGWSKWFTVLSGAGNAWWGFEGPGGVGRNVTQRRQTLAPNFAHQWLAGTAATRAFIQPVFNNGEWVKIELYINTRPGEERVRAWMNGELVLNGVPQWGSSVPPIQQLKLGSTLGGGSGLPTLDSRYFADYALVESYGR